MNKLNSNFQKLHLKYRGTRSSKDLQAMRDNLLCRNGGDDAYRFRIVGNTTISISNCTYEELLKINGNMNLNNM